MPALVWAGKFRRDQMKFNLRIIAEGLPQIARVSFRAIFAKAKDGSRKYYSMNWIHAAYLVQIKKMVGACAPPSNCAVSV